MSNKRATTVGILTAGIAASILATTVGPAAAQGNPVGGKGSIYHISGAENVNGKAQKVYAFGNPDDEIYFGDWYGHGEDQPMVRRGNAFIVPQDATDGNPNLTQNTFVYGDAGDTVLVGDWDGDGIDTLAVRRGNHYLVKNDNLSTGKADTDFYFGDAGDKVLVGNWDGVTSDEITEGVDNNGDKDFDDAGTPGYVGDIKPIDDPGFNGEGGDPKDYTQPGDRLPGTGVDNNKDGDFDDEAVEAVEADVPPTVAKGDTLMIQRSNKFFVKNTLSTGNADYTFFFGDANDSVIVGNWATMPTMETADDSAKPAAPASAGDQLAIRRGNMYHLSSEISKTALAGKNPKTTSVVAYGEPTDTVFVASLTSPAVDAYNKPAVDDSETDVDETAPITGDGFGVRR